MQKPPNRRHCTRISIIDSNSVAEEFAFERNLYRSLRLRRFVQSNTIDNKLLRACNFNHYLEENLTYDANKSEQVRSSLLGQISQTSGLSASSVERIIDRGEIIESTNFSVLNSLKIITERDQLSDRNHYWVMAGEVFRFQVFTTSFSLFTPIPSTDF